MQLFAWALVCVWERKQRKQKQRRKRKTRVTIGNGETPDALKGNTLPSRLFVPIYLLRCSQTLLCVGLPLWWLPLGTVPKSVSHYCFSGWRANSDENVKIQFWTNILSVCFSELWGLLRCQRGQCCLCFSRPDCSPRLEGTHTHTHRSQQSLLSHWLMCLNTYYLCCVISLQTTHTLRNESGHAGSFLSLLSYRNAGASPLPQWKVQGVLPVPIETEGVSCAWRQMIHKLIASSLPRMLP